MTRLNSGEIIFALGLVLIGVLLLLGTLGLVAFNWNMVWPLILILFGVWLILRAFQPARANVTSFGFGDYQPDFAGREIRHENLSHGFGDFDLDLTRATVPEGKSSVRASHGFGSLRVIVPRNLALRVKASAGFGDATVFDRKREGVGAQIDFQSDDYAAATRKLDLAASVGFGDVKVIWAG